MAYDVFLLVLLFRECSTLTNIKRVINIMANTYLPNIFAYHKME